MLYYSFVRFYHEAGGGDSKGTYEITLCYILQLHVNYNYLKIKCFIKKKKSFMTLQFKSINVFYDKTLFPQ